MAYLVNSTSAGPEDVKVKAEANIAKESFNYEVVRALAGPRSYLRE